MGNSSSSSSSRRNTGTVNRSSDSLHPRVSVPHSSILTVQYADWSEHHVKKLINEKKLAPKTENQSENREVECPICFLNYEELNTVACCRQLICTDCYVQLKSGQKGCPFCGTVQLTASFLIHNDAKKIPIVITNEEEKQEMSSPVQSDSSRKSSIASLSSIDRLSNSNSKDKIGGPLHVPKLSKSDREAIENQIKDQRIQFRAEEEREHSLNNFDHTRNIPRSLSTPYRSNGNLTHNRNSSANNSIGNARLRFQRNAMSTHSPWLEGSEGNEPNSSQSDRSRYGGANFRSSTANNSSRATRIEEEREHFMQSIQALILGNNQSAAANQDAADGRGNAPMNRIASLEQLEELMLMEAIRASMSEPSTVPSTSAEISSVSNPSNVITETPSSIFNFFTQNSTTSTTDNISPLQSVRNSSNQSLNIPSNNLNVKMNSSLSHPNMLSSDKDYTLNNHLQTYGATTSSRSDFQQRENFAEDITPMFANNRSSLNPDATRKRVGILYMDPNKDNYSKYTTITDNRDSCSLGNQKSYDEFESYDDDEEHVDYDSESIWSNEQSQKSNPRSMMRTSTSIDSSIDFYNENEVRIRNAGIPIKLNPEMPIKTLRFDRNYPNYDESPRYESSRLGDSSATGSYYSGDESDGTSYKSNTGSRMVSDDYHDNESHHFKNFHQNSDNHSTVKEFSEPSIFEDQEEDTTRLRKPMDTTVFQDEEMELQMALQLSLESGNNSLPLHETSINDDSVSLFVPPVKDGDGVEDINNDNVMGKQSNKTIKNSFEIESTKLRIETYGNHTNENDHHTIIPGNNNDDHEIHPVNSSPISLIEKIQQALNTPPMTNTTSSS